jgi:NADPH:quinone reductase-like Zn-dependent oxidoreductase
MKAAMLPAVNEPLQIRDIDTPTLEENEVLVQVRAAALNHRDNWIKKGLYAGIKYPVIPAPTDRAL